MDKEEIDVVSGLVCAGGGIFSGCVMGEIMSFLIGSTRSPTPLFGGIGFALLVGAGLFVFIRPLIQKRFSAKEKG